MSKSLLLVEDDETFRKVIKNVVETLGFNVSEAENGMVGKSIYDQNPAAFDIVISDVRMPEMTGIELLKHIRQTNKNLKFVLMTGFSELIEAQQAYDIGATEFLAKPFRLENLKKVIAACFAPPKTGGEAGAEEKYCRIPVEDFVSSSKLLVDLHVRMGSDKFVKIAHAGDVVPVDRLKMYKEKKVDSFFVRPEDLRKVVGLNLRAAPVNSDQKAKLLASTAAMIAKSPLFASVDKTAFAEATQILDNTLNMIADDPGLSGMIAFLQSHGGKHYAHGTAISIYACMIGLAMGHRSPAQQTRIAMGALLCDVGFQELAPDLGTKPRASMSAPEIVAYETHPQRGKDMIAKVAGVPEDVVMIIAHHHENNVGTGFPYRLAAGRIHPLAKIVAVAGSFVSALETNPDAGQALAKLQGAELDPNVLRALGSIIPSKAAAA